MGLQGTLRRLWQPSDEARSQRESLEKIRHQADERARLARRRVRDNRKSAENLANDRRKLARKLAPRMERVCKKFSRGVRGSMKPCRLDHWSKGNAAWCLQTAAGGIEVQTWPWVLDKSKPRLLRGIWMQYVGPDGQELVSESKVSGTKLDHSYELGEGTASSSGYYYWIHTHDGTYYDFHTGPCVFGCFLSLKDFSEERLASALEEIGRHILQGFTHNSFFRMRK